MPHGKHLIVDVDNIGNFHLLGKLEGVTPLMQSIIKKCKLNVKQFCSHQFEPYGCTMLYLLAESHFSIHTFPEYRACSIDIYTCNMNTDFNLALDLISKYFDTPLISKNILTR